jgi:protocatechuate 3,4-dioxygenase beta subunit
MDTDTKRRQLMLGLAGLMAAGPALAARLLPTPKQMAGPFYPLEPPLDKDNDLTRVAGVAGVAEGRVTDLAGRVLDPDGRPIHGARVEIWQCDARGRYHHPHDDGPAPDPRFQGFGQHLTDAQGRYRFRTIRPVPYPGRTPHIHMAVFAPGGEPLVTQLYVAGDPRNERDFLFRAVAPERRRLVQAEFLPSRGGRAELAAGFDIILAGRDGTPRA